MNRQGVIEEDYQTVSNILTLSADPQNPKGDADIWENNNSRTKQTYRQYLADADFLVGLHGPVPLLQEIDEALHHPYWSLYLGRRAFPPTLPVWVINGLKVGKGLLEALTEYPYDCLRQYEKPEPLLVYYEVGLDEVGEIREDGYFGLQNNTRVFVPRKMQHAYVTSPLKEKH